MGSETMQLRGRIEVAKSRVQELRLEAKSLIIAIRQALDPYEPDPARLPTDQARVSAVRLDAVVAELRVTTLRLQEMERDLNG